ncbi:MAG: sugar ABC transporter ATP-binding protein [Verrucomicrobia bacterium]|nr:sugar ABC transporter ATP-binding protein [Verrucomicrobiota bacterium]
MSHPAAQPPRLRLAGVAKAFGATLALRGVSLEVGFGEVHAVVGENGAGKSTLMNILSGALRPDAGTIELDGRPYAPVDTLDARRHGVAMIHQELSLAPHLSVTENIMLGAEPQRLGWIDRKESRARAAAALAQLGHEHLELDRPAGSFSIAEQQVIEIARALRTEPRVLIMDEPTSSLAQADTERLFTVIRQLRDRGVSVIYISHFLEEVKQVADRYTVIKDGQSVGSGEIAGTSQATLVRLMVGREVAELYPPRRPAVGAPVLTVADLQAGPRLGRAGFTLAAGEIVGVAGLIGAGRTELVRAVFGLDRCAGGVVTLDGRNVTGQGPRAGWESGLGFLSENRKEEGLMLPLSVAENTVLPKLGRMARLGWIDRRGVDGAAREWIGRLGIKAREPGQRVGELSGGNQQKVALARLLAYPSRVFLLDEPTRGIDVGSKAQIYELVAGLAQQGRAVLLVSSYLPELFGMCDRIAVMRRGELADCRPTAEWTEATLMATAIGTAA